MSSHPAGVVELGGGDSTSRLVGWNVCRRGGCRAARIAAARDVLASDIVGLSGFHKNSRAQHLIDWLSDMGLSHPITSSAEPRIQGIKRTRRSLEVSICR